MVSGIASSFSSQASPEYRPLATRPSWNRNLPAKRKFPQYGERRGPIRAAQARGAEGMAAEVAADTAAGSAGYVRGMARARRQRGSRSSQDRADHSTAVRRLGARLCVHLRARNEIGMVGGADRWDPHGRRGDGLRW